METRLAGAGDVERLAELASRFADAGEQTSEHRSAGIGTALLRTLLKHAETLNLEHVTVHSSSRAVSVYERAGFAATRDLLWWSAGR